MGKLSAKEYAKKSETAKMKKTKKNKLTLLYCCQEAIF
jgi:hypothetical protein